MTSLEVLDCFNHKYKFYNNVIDTIDSTGTSLSNTLGFGYFDMDYVAPYKVKKLEEYMQNNIVKDTKANTLKAFYEFLQNSSEVLSSLPEEPAWKKAYISYLENDFVTDYASLKTKPQIALYDFDSDGVTEMIIDDTGNTNGYVVIGFYNNEIKKSEVPNFLTFDGTKIKATSKTPGGSTIFTGEFKNGEIILTEQGHLSRDMELDARGNAEYTEKFYWGNTEVTSDEYTKKEEAVSIVNDKLGGLTFQNANIVKNSL